MGGEESDVLIEIDNLQAAWRWAVLDGNAAAIRRSSFALANILTTLGRLQEGQVAFGAAVGALRAGKPVGERGIALGVALVQQGWFFWPVSRPEKGRPLVQEGLSILRRLDARLELAWCDAVAACIGWMDADISEAKHHLEQSYTVFEEMGMYKGVASSLNLLGYEAMGREAYGEAERYCRQARALVRDRGGDYRGYSTGLGNVAYARAEYAQARQFYEERLTWAIDRNDRWFLDGYHNDLADVAIAVGQYEKASAYCQRALVIARDMGDTREIVRSLVNLGLIALGTNDHPAARRHCREACRYALDRQDESLRATAVLGRAVLLAETGDPERAVELLTLALQRSMYPVQWKSIARRYLDQAQAQLSPAAFAVALERGRARDLEATVQELLDELGE